MVEAKLTSREARVIYTALYNSWMPIYGYEEFKNAVQKLGVIAGGFCCRDCSDIATIPHPLGGLVCERHRPNRPPIRHEEIA